MKKLYIILGLFLISGRMDGIPASGLKIVPFEVGSHLKPVLEICKQNDYDGTVLEPYLRKHSPGSATFVLEENGNTIGFIRYSGEEVDLVMVASAMQSQGHGDRLLRFAEDRIKESGGKKVLLTVMENPKAKGFYKKRGYSETSPGQLTKEL